MGPSGRARRILFYCHDSYGLGHLRRTLALAHHLQGRWPSAPQLIVTGSPCAERFRFPETADYIKLPSVVKVGAGRYEARSLPISFHDVWSIRRHVLFGAGRSFQPDALIVDNVPAGLKGELVPTLRHLKEGGRTRLILGLRDVVVEATRVSRAWSREGIYELLDDVYDLILVYGDPGVYDPVREYGFSARAAAKTRYVGYIPRRSGGRAGEEVRTELGLRTDRLVLVTAGGGGDGYELLRSTLAGLRPDGPSPPFDCLVVSGPLMSAEQRGALRRLVPEGSGIHFREFVDDLTDYLAAADAVVSMAGYNSVCEIVSFQRPAIIVPRVEPRREQLIRAEALSRRGLVRMIHPADLTPTRLLTEIRSLLERPRGRYVAPAMDGLNRAADELEAALRPLPHRAAARPRPRPRVA